MGAKLLVENETTRCHFDETKKYINLQNWRGIKEDYHERIVGIFIILLNFRIYFIPSINIQEFHFLNISHQIIDTPYKYVHNTLSCNHCFGTGKLDWIENARDKRGSDIFNINDDVKFKFTRHTSGIVHLTDDGSYVSTALLHMGENHCRKCCGSGLYYVEPSIIKQSMKLKEWLR